MKVTIKGQVTIPQEIRKLLKIKPASEVEFVVEEGDRVYLQARAPKEDQSIFPNLRGSATIRMTTDEIMALTRED
jgi:AbrB family looped-hinge helix DNA binding protein